MYQTQQTFIMFITVLGQHVSILIESSSGPSKNTDPYLAMFTIRCGIPDAYIRDITMYKMDVSLCSTRMYTYVWVPVNVLEISILIVQQNIKTHAFYT